MPNSTEKGPHDLQRTRNRTLINGAISILLAELAETPIP